MRLSLKKIALAATFAVASFAAQAATVLSTGTVAGTTDFTSSVAGGIVGVSHPSYIANDANSSWVWASNQAASPVTFSVSFNLAFIRFRPPHSAVCGVRTTMARFT